jgi:hypothetical protein
MSNSNNDGKKGKEIDHDLAKLVKEIFNSDGKVIQPTEEDLVNCPVPLIPLSLITYSFLSGLCPHLRGIMSQTPSGQGTRMLTVASHAGRIMFILSKI